MGCTQSKIENETAVSRCKGRKHFMEEAVSYRKAFAAAYSAYAMVLKKTGAALNDYAQGESTHDRQTASTAAQPLSEPLFPPPPPPAYPTPPKQRAASMQEMKLPKTREPSGVGPTILEENDDEDDEMETHEKLITRKRSSGRNKSGESKLVVNVDHAPPPPAPAKSDWQLREPSPPQPQISTWDYFFPPMEQIPGTTLEEVKEDEKVFEERPKREEDAEEKAKIAAAAAEEEKATAVAVEEEKVVVAHFLKIFEKLDDHFLKASKSAHDVSEMLEEIKLKEKCKRTEAELNRGNLVTGISKYTQQRTPESDAVQERKKFAIDMVEERLKDEKKAHGRLRKQNSSESSS